MSDADRALQAAIASTDQQNTLWEQNYQTSQDAYQRSLAAATAAQGNVANETPQYLIKGTPDWARYNELVGTYNTPESTDLTGFDKYNLGIELGDENLKRQGLAEMGIDYKTAGTAGWYTSQ